MNSGVTITLQMLLQHQSGLADAPFDTFTVNAPTAVATFSTFCNNYFTTAATGGGFTMASNLFSGVTGNYSYSRMNVVLLTCIIENYVSSKKTSLSGPLTAASYIQNAIFNPLGMVSTFTVNSTGGLPLSTYPLGAPIYSGSLVQDLPSGSVSTLNPGFTADLMYFTSSADLAAFVRSAFITSSPTGIFSAFGTTMKTPMSSSSFSSSVRAVIGQTTFSLYTFDPSVMCSLAINSGFETTCPLTTSSTVYGYMSRGRFSVVGFFCTSQSSTTPTCVNVHFSHYDVGTSPSAAVVTKQYELLLGMAAVAFCESIGTSSIALLYLGPGKTTDLYGLYVFIGVSGIVAFVLIASYITEYLVQPAPVATGLPPPLTLPQHGAYPQSFGGPPLPRHDFYGQ